MTTTVTVRRTLRSPAAELYATFADSERLARVPGVGVRVIDTGSGGGVGVRRRLTLPGGIFLLEHVVGLDPKGLVFDYRIEDSRPRFHHEQGRVKFAAHRPGTDVTWTSTASLGPHVAERVGDLAVRTVARGSFTAALILIDRHLQSTTTKDAAS